MHVSIQTTNSAVKVRKGCKAFGNHVVLDQLDMTVPIGTTYALLGSSGCGKTTLLSSLVGLIELSKGSIQIFGEDPSKLDITLVGYMPQESGLHSELRISEELHYFGRLYALNWKLVQERIKLLIKLLQLPDNDPVIRNLSGGELRRVSLAVSLLHKPPLLILDEPTVGIDPYLRESIWEYLYKLVKDEGTTIILSTHYTEEARHADVVSVLRQGRILVEESPRSLMDRYDSEILEDIVVKLARNQEMDVSKDQPQSESGFNKLFKRFTSKKETENIVNISYKRRNSKNNTMSKDAVAQNKFRENPANQLRRRSSGEKCRSVISAHDRINQPNSNNIKSSRIQNWLLHQLHVIHGIIMLNFITHFRHPWVLCILLTMPANNLSSMYYLYNLTPYTDIGVVNLEQANCFKPSNEYKLGCELTLFLQESKYLQIAEFSSEDSALAALHRGVNYGYIVIPRNFSINIFERVTFGRFADAEILDGSSISIHLDYSNSLRTGLLYQGLNSGFLDFIELKLNDTAVAKERSVNFGGISSKPFKINEKLMKLYPVETSWAEVAAVAQIAFCMVIMPAIVGVTMVLDKKRGAFSRTLIAGGSLPHLVLASMAVYFLIFLFQIISTWITVLYLNIPCKGSFLDFAIVNYAQSLVGLSFGFLLGTIFNQEIEVIFLIMALFITCSASQEVSSLEAVHQKWVRWMITALPTKIPTNSLENICFRGWNFSDFGVWRCLIVQGAWIFGCLGFTTFSFYKRRS